MSTWANIFAMGKLEVVSYDMTKYLCQNIYGRVPV